MQAKGLVTWEVATLAAYRKRYRDYSKAKEDYDSICRPVWLQEYHGNKLVREISKGALS